MICKGATGGDEMNLSQQSQGGGQRDSSRALCPASLCRLLRGIASAGSGGGAAPSGAQPQPRAPPPPPTTLAGQSFTIAAILGLKGQAHHTYSECSSGTQQQVLKSKSRPISNIVQAPSQTVHHSSKSKRVRTIFTPEQLERLEAEFERQQYMVGPERLYLAHALQLTEAQVKVWFQNRRIKWRKQHLEITQQRLALARRQQLADQVDAGSSSCSLPDAS